MTQVRLLKKLTCFKLETFGGADIPEDGGRYIAMNSKGYADLFNINEFASSDFVGEQNLPFAGGMTMKEFLGFKIFSTSAVSAGKSFAYHTSAVGLAVGSDVSTEVNYVPQKVAHLITAHMSMGAVVIDDNGVYELLTIIHRRALWHMRLQDLQILHQAQV